MLPHLVHNPWDSGVDRKTVYKFVRILKFPDDIHRLVGMEE